ncbi:hypothetical protein FC44_GL000775 [Lactobacillus intestinalis DSM 6629]|uniref:Uncharacterized protein n=1 Tax=Lactobacillus intestinalis DSM 6629 TaxID=1423761 RepID=A0ABR5PSY7_9LACO|nr:hypothetical protein FC44_GL000775 [Lactobacillus intestinalis DSM 6629]
MCGEYSTVFHQKTSKKGSPPRVWGIPCLWSRSRIGSRITPTCVGNTQELYSALHTSRDHPHVCGEYSTVFHQKISKKGSPPRVWGIHATSGTGTFFYGITPTCVGNTSNASEGLTIIEDHPHVCGEYSYQTAIKLPAIGSPPRVWGILHPLPSNR